MPFDTGPFTPEQLADIAWKAAETYCVHLKRGVDPRELYGEAYIGAVDGNREYDPRRSGSMSRRSFVFSKARYQIVNWQRSRPNNWSRVDDKILADPREPEFIKFIVELSCVGPDQQPAIEPGDAEVLLKRLQAVVGKRNARIYRKVSEGMTYREVAEAEPRRRYKGRMVVISASAVCKVTLQCREIMRSIVADYLNDE